MKHSRSQAYQYKFRETQTGDVFLGTFSNGQDLHPHQSQEWLELKDLLLVKVKELAERELTDVQLEILNMWLDGKTQWEIAIARGRNQSSTFKSLFGNKVNNKQTTYYGGAIPKLKKLCQDDLGIQWILAAMNDLEV